MIMPPLQQLLNSAKDELGAQKIAAAYDYCEEGLREDIDLRVSNDEITYPGDNGVWAFLGDIPLHERAEDGQVLIASEWMEIS